MNDYGEWLVGKEISVRGFSDLNGEWYIVKDYRESDQTVRIVRRPEPVGIPGGLRVPLKDVLGVISKLGIG